MKRQKKNHEFHIKLEMRERKRKRLTIAQSIQRELGECEVKQMELEKRGVMVEKKMAQLEAGEFHCECVFHWTFVMMTAKAWYRQVIFR